MQRIKVGVHGDFDEVWPQDIAARFEHNRGRRNGYLQLIRREIPRQPPHQAAVVGLPHNIVIGDLARAFRFDRWRRR